MFYSRKVYSRESRHFFGLSSADESLQSLVKICVWQNLSDHLPLAGVERSMDYQQRARNSVHVPPDDGIWGIDGGAFLYKP